MGDRSGRERQAVTTGPAGLLRRVRPFLPAGAVAVLCLVSTAVLVRLTSGLWFFGDDWDFLLRRGVHLGGTTGLLEPHNEHWSTVPILLYRLVFSFVGLGSYLAYAVLPIIAHVVCTVLMYVVLRRLGVRPWIAVVAVAFLAFLGAGAENLEWDFQVSFFSPVVFGLAAITVCAGATTGAGRSVLGIARLTAVWLLVVLGLMSSGVGISATVWVTMFVLGAFGIRAALATAVPPALVYLLWFATYGRGHDLEKPGPPELVLETALKGMADIWQRVVPVPGFGGAFLLLLVVTTLVGRSDERLRSLAAAGLAALLPFYLLVSVSRVGIGGVEAGMASRYAYIGVVLTLPAVALALTVVADRLLDRPGLTTLASLVLVGLVAGQGVSALVTFRQTRLAQVGETRDIVLAGVRLAEDGDVLLGRQLVDGADVDQFLTSSVRTTLPTTSPSPQARLEASARLQVGVGGAPFDGVPDVAAPVRVRGASGVLTRSGACTTGVAGADTTVKLPAAQGGSQVSVVTAGTQLVTRLSAPPRLSALSTSSLAANTVTWVATSSSYELRITLPAGSFRVCAGPQA